MVALRPPTSRSQRFSGLLAALGCGNDLMSVLWTELSAKKTKSPPESDFSPPVWIDRLQ
jgi:hypothetical protein